MKDLILTQLLPQLFDYLIVTILGLMYVAVQRASGVQIEAKYREALQSALANGARLLLQPGGTIDDAIDYVLASVPDALKRFGRTQRDQVQELLEPHILAIPALPTSRGISASAADNVLSEILGLGSKSDSSATPA